MLINDMRCEWGELDRRIHAFDSEFAVRARADLDARHLTTIPGIGVLNATALVAAIGKGAEFCARARSCSLARPRPATADGRRQNIRSCEIGLPGRKPRAVGDPMHVETSFVRNLGDLIRARAGMPGRFEQ
jgi:hypothetical protein